MYAIYGWRFVQTALGLERVLQRTLLENYIVQDDIERCVLWSLKEHNKVHNDHAKYYLLTS